MTIAGSGRTRSSRCPAIPGKTTARPANAKNPAAELHMGMRSLHVKVAVIESPFVRKGDEEDITGDAHQGTQNVIDLELQDARKGHGVARGTDRHPQRADRLSHDA